MEIKRLQIPAIAAAALVLVAATPTGEVRSADPGHPQLTQQTPNPTVVVRNFNSLDVEVVAVSESGRRHTLGAVNSGRGRSFSLPERFVRNSDRFCLKVYSIGRSMGPALANHYLGAVRTQMLSPEASDEIVLQVRSPLSSSFIDRGS